MDNDIQKIDLFSLINGLRKSILRLWVIGVALMVLLGGLMGLRTWHSYIPYYRASTSFIVQMKNPFYATQQYYNNAAAEQMAKTFPQILTSGLLSDRVMEEMQIDFMPSVSASAVGNTNIFTLSVSSTDPQLSYDVLNSVIKNYPSVAELVVGSTELNVIDQSGMPQSPYNHPDYIGSIAKGVLAGLAIWLVMALLFWITHRTVENEQDLRQVVNLSCVGRLPRVRRTAKNRCPVLDDRNDKFGFNESVRLLRIRVERALADKKVLLVTSALPNEGKTTVSVNIATALSHKGKKVLLVDCDLRNPSIGRIFNLQTEYGFTDYLKGRCSQQQIFTQTKTENLVVVAGGKPVENPAALLSLPQAKTFMETAKEEFDYIILDTPPCAMMSDVAEIGELADANLLTIREDYALRRQIIEAVQNLDDNKKPVIGAVINMVTPQIGRGGYYGYGYGYGYGYYGRGKDEEE